jgi:O-Antigen ligase
MMHNRINLMTISLSIFFLLLMFSNMMSRILGVNINGALYLAFLISFLFSLMSLRVNAVSIATFIMALFMLVYVADTRYYFGANLMTLKDFILPLFCFFIGVLLARYREIMITHLNGLLTINAGYGILQELSFYSGTLQSWLPWDAAHIDALLSKGQMSIFQGQLLRFFGTMNSYVEYQVTLVFFMALVLFNADVLRKRRLLYVNVFLVFLFLILAVERSPIMMALVLLAFWKWKSLLRNALRPVKVIALLILIAVLPLFGEVLSLETTRFSIAFERLKSVVTLSILQDEAVQERVNVQWAEAFNMSVHNYTGIGPGRVAPSSQELPGYIGPHNNFLVMHLAYGYVGFLLFLIYLSIILLQLSRLPGNQRYFGYGLVASYSLMGMFNLPFTGKMGIMFFLIVGFLMRMSTDGEHDVSLPGYAQQNIIGKASNSADV